MRGFGSCSQVLKEQLQRADRVPSSAFHKPLGRGGVTLLKSIIGGTEGEEVASDTANSGYELPGQLMRETNAPPSQSHLMRTEK